MSYRNPIITEVFAVLRLEEGSLTPANVFDIVPLLRDRGYGSVELGNVEIQVPATSQLKFDTRVRCWNEGHTRLIQVGTDFLAANHSVNDGEYLGWSGFREVLDTAIEAYRKVTDHSVNASSVEVGTIDQLTAEAEGFKMGRYLNCGGNKIPSWYSNASVPADLSLGRGIVNIDGYNKRYKIALRFRDGEAHIRIDSNFSRLVSQENLADIVESLHRESTEHFEELITDHTREHVMGGIQ